MDNASYTITEIAKNTDDVFILKAIPATGTISPFLAGQFCGIRQKGEDLKTKTHFFSLASSPTTKDHLEFCFKVYGDWTKRLSQVTPGTSLFLSGPFGKFIWENTIQHAVFLAGGVGITPFMSMLRFIKDTNQKPSITLLYGNRIEQHIAYKNEIDQIISTLPNSKTVHVLSEVGENEPWDGYRGFITKEILEKEVDFSVKPTFFICGPPIFVQLSQKLLAEFLVPEQNIKQELFSV